MLTVTMLKILTVLKRFLYAKYNLFIYFGFRVKVFCWGVISFKKIHPADFVIFKILLAIIHQNTVSQDYIILP